MDGLGKRNRRMMANLNIIPLVDIVLVLLIIFMVTAPMMYRGIDVDLPKATTSSIKQEERIVLSVTKERTVYLDKEQVTLGTLEYALLNIKKKKPDITIYLKADKAVPYGIVVQVMDIIKKVGIDRLGMVTEPLSTVKDKL